MASSGNFFSSNVFNIPNTVKSTVPGAPLVITINPFAEGIIDYTLSCATLGSYVTYFNIVGTTIGVAFTFYLPSTNGLLGQTITVKNSSGSPVFIIPSTNAQIDEGIYGSISLPAPPSPADLGAATLMANPTNVDSWYITNTFIQI